MSSALVPRAALEDRLADGRVDVVDGVFYCNACWAAFLDDSGVDDAAPSSLITGQKVQQAAPLQQENYSTSKATAKDSSSTGSTKGFLNRRPKPKMPPGKKQNAGGRPGEQNAEESDKKKTSSETGSSGAKASGKRTKKEQRMFNYITKRKKMLGGELSALKKCMKMV